MKVVLNMEYKGPSQSDTISSPEIELGKGSLTPESAVKTTENYRPKKYLKLARHLRRLAVTIALSTTLITIINHSSRSNEHQESVITNRKDADGVITPLPEWMQQYQTSRSLLPNPISIQYAELKPPIDDSVVQSYETGSVPQLDQPIETVENSQPFQDLLRVREHSEPQSSKLLLSMEDGVIQIFDSERESPISEAITAIWPDQVITHHTYEVVPEYLHHLVDNVSLQEGDRLFAVNIDNILIKESNDNSFSIYYYNHSTFQAETLVQDVNLSDIELVLQATDGMNYSYSSMIDLLDIVSTAPDRDSISRAAQSISAGMENIPRYYRFDYANVAMRYAAAGDHGSFFFFDVIYPIFVGNENLTYSNFDYLAAGATYTARLDTSSLQTVKEIFLTYNTDKNDPTYITTLIDLLRVTSYFGSTALPEFLQKHIVDSQLSIGEILAPMSGLGISGYTLDEVSYFLDSAIASGWDWPDVLEIGYILSDIDILSLMNSQNLSKQELVAIVCQIFGLELQESERYKFASSLHSLLLHDAYSEQKSELADTNIETYYQYSRFFDIYEDDASYAVYKLLSASHTELPSTQLDYVLSLTKYKLQTEDETIAVFVNTVHDNELTEYQTDNLRDQIFSSMSTAELYTFLSRDSMHIVGSGWREASIEDLAYTSTVLKAYHELVSRGADSVVQFLNVAPEEDTIMFAATLGRYGLLGPEVQKNPTAYLSVFEDALDPSDQLHWDIQLLTRLLSDGLTAGLTSDSSDQYANLLFDTYNQYLQQDNEFNAATIAYLILINKQITSQTHPDQYSEIASNWPGAKEVNIPDWSKIPVITVVTAFNESTVIAEGTDVFEMTQKILESIYGYNRNPLQNDQGDTYLVKKLPSGQEIHFILSYDNLTEILNKYGAPQIVAHLSHSYDRESFWVDLESSLQKLTDGSTVAYDGSCGSAHSGLDAQLAGVPFFGVQRTGTGPTNVQMIAIITAALAQGQSDWNIQGIHIPSYSVVPPGQASQGLGNFLTQAGFE